MKTNLPVILLKGIVLLPNNELRLEIDNEFSKSIIEISEHFHDNKILIVSNSNPLEETLDKKEFPKFGVIAKIKQKIELPNGKTRVLFQAISRARVLDYLNLNRPDDVLESIVEALAPEKIDDVTNRAIIRKIEKELEGYIRSIPYISNSLLSLIEGSTDLSHITDIIAPNLSINLDRNLEYLYETESLKRAGMILEDIYYEVEMFSIENDLDKKVKNVLENTQREFILREKIKFMKEELGEVSAKDDETDKIRNELSDLNLPENIREKIESELKRYEMLSSTSPEINISRTYIDWLISLPWNIVTEDNEDLLKVKELLDSSHYGLLEVKDRIIEYLAVKKLTKELRGPILCLTGPPGVGKTSLATSIATAMDRNFVKMAVGGVHDESEIRGHRRTYLGANPGRIISSLKRAKSSNPVFLIDEIDKMTKDFRGDPASALLEVLDPEQNKFFSDNYIEEEFDLSKVMFITTANDIEKIPEALKDRLEIVEINGYTEYEKLDIAKKHLISKICIEHGLSASKISFDDDIILTIIRYYTKEAGVRELERQISKIVRKIIKDTLSIDKKLSKTKINKAKIKKYLGKEKYHYAKVEESQIGVVNGLAYTTYGGDTLPIEVNYYKGTGKLELTGSLGNIMKESANIALSYIKSNWKIFDIDYELLNNSDIHIHVPEGAVPKDGPSAGTALTTALISAFTKTKIMNNIAMTGEITLRGTILPVGGLREKAIGAYRNGVNKIFIPEDNKRDIEKLPEELKENINFITVKKYMDIYSHIKDVIQK